MYKFFIPLFIALIFTQCTKIYVEEKLPELQSISPTNMATKLKRVNIVVDASDWEYLTTNFDNDIQIQASIYLYQSNGQSVFEDQKAEIEIKGIGSSNSPMKPLGILFKELQDNTEGRIIDADASGTLDYSKIKNLRLRNSGSDFGKTQLKDYVLSEYAESQNLRFEIKHGEPVHVFVNGSYYGLFDMRTEADPPALSQMYNVAESDITYIKVDPQNGNLEHKNGDVQLVEYLRNAINNFDAETLNSLIDVNSFIDYILYEDYVSNDDWPHNNVAAYCLPGGKFRFILYDLDQAFFRTKDPVLPELEYLTADLAKIYQSFITLPWFVELLNQRQKEIYEIFSPENFEQFLSIRANYIRDEIPFQIARWGAPNSTLQWNHEIEILRREQKKTDQNNRKHYNLH